MNTGNTSRRVAYMRVASSEVITRSMAMAARIIVMRTLCSIERNAKATRN